MSQDRVEWLEERTDFYADQTPPIKMFILPGGSKLSALSHVCRTTTRRCERLIVSLAKEEEINRTVLVYFNRLSDYFFSLARALNARLGVQDRVWGQSTDVFVTDEEGD